MVRRPLEFVTMDHFQISRVLLQWHQRVTLAVDIMFVNWVQFLNCVSRGLTLVTDEYIPSCMAKQLAASITRVMDLYLCGGFHMGMVLMYNGFEKLRNLVPILVVRQQPEVEQRIWMIKEKGRGIQNTALFKRMPLVKNTPPCPRQSILLV